MRFAVRIAKRAATQIAEAAEWWAGHRDKAPDALAEEVEKAFDLIAALPAAGQRVSHSTLRELRRLHLERIRYFVYYQVDRSGEAVEVLAFWHTRRGSEPDL